MAKVFILKGIGRDECRHLGLLPVQLRDEQNIWAFIIYGYFIIAYLNFNMYCLFYFFTTLPTVGLIKPEIFKG